MSHRAHRAAAETFRGHRFLRRLIGGLVAALVLIMSAGIARADIVKNTLVTDATSTVSTTTGVSQSATYWLDAENANADGQTNCNASDGTPANITLKYPNNVSVTPASGVTLTPAQDTTDGMKSQSFQLTDCTRNQGKSISFASSIPGNYLIDVTTVTDGGSSATTGTYSIRADFTLRVEGSPTVASDAGNISEVQGLTQTMSGSFADPNGVGTLATIAARSTDAGTLTVMRGLDGKLTGLWTWEYTPTAVGNGSVRVTATDDTGKTAFDDFTWASTANSAPTVSTAADDVSKTVGQQQTTTGAFADADGVSTLRIEKRAGDAGTVTANANGTWSWSFTPSAVGNGTVRVIATDHTGASIHDEFNWSATSAIAATTVSAVSGSGTYGGNATLTAKLESGTTALASKTVAFTLGTTVVGSATTNASGVASISGVSLTEFNAGTHTGAVTASFAGDTSHAAHSATGNLVVGQAASTVSAVGGTGTFGGTATLTATVKSGDNPLSGRTVTFNVGTAEVGQARTDGNGVATLEGVSLAGRDAGTHTGLVTASAAAGGNYAAHSTTGNLVVGQAASTVSAVGGTGTFGGTATLTATVKSGDNPLSGRTVTFNVGTAEVGQARTDGNGVATLEGVSLAGRDAGTHAGEVTAHFDGETNYSGDRATGSLVVNQAASTMSAVSGSGTFGGTATLTATLKVGSAALSNRTVAFTVAGTSVGTAMTDANGVATKTGVSLAGRTVGTHTVTASFAGETNYTVSSANGNLAVRWDYSGFFRPVDNKDASGAYILNQVKAGSTVPVKFSLAGDQGLDIWAKTATGAVGGPTSGSINCDPAATTDTIEELSTASTSGLKYDATAGQYIYTWKTASSWAGSCRQLVVKFADGTEQRASFKLTK